MAAEHRIVGEYQGLGEKRTPNEGTKNKERETECIITAEVV